MFQFAWKLGTVTNLRTLVCKKELRISAFYLKSVTNSFFEMQWWNDSTFLLLRIILNKDEYALELF